MDGNIYTKTYNFAIKIFKLYQGIVKEKRDYIISSQILRSGTSIGANVREACYAQSKKDFLSKMNIALKEAAETEYWLSILQETKFIDENKSKKLLEECIEIIKILTRIVKSTKASLKEEAKKIK